MLEQFLYGLIYSPCPYTKIFDVIVAKDEEEARVKASTISIEYSLFRLEFDEDGIANIGAYSE